jgi:hypothetical protein
VAAQPTQPPRRSRLVTDTAKLEWALLYPVAVAEGHEVAGIDSTLSSPGGQPLKQLRRFVTTRGKFRPHLIDLSNKAESAILARHTVAHSVPAVDGSQNTSERTLQFWHPNTATLRDADELSARNSCCSRGRHRRSGRSRFSLPVASLTLSRQTSRRH